jgi:protein-disulfide isomerase
MAMNENESKRHGSSDDEILDLVRTRLSRVEPLVPVPPAWQQARASYEQGSRMKVRVRPAGAVGFGGVLAVLLVAVIIGMSLAHQGPLFSGGSNPAESLQWTTIVYELQPVDGAQPSAADLATTVSILENRVASTGVATTRVASTDAAAPEVTAQPPNRVTVRVPGMVDLDTLRNLLGSTGKLEFVLLPPETYGTSETAGPKPVPGIGESIDPSLPAQFNGGQLDGSKVAAGLDTGNGDWDVEFSFKGAASSEFETWSAAHINDYFAVVLDGEIVTAPYIKAPVSAGSGVILGGFTAAAARQLATILQYGQLPFPLIEISHEVSTEPAPTPSTSNGIADSIIVPGVTTPTDLPSNGRTLGNPNALVTLGVWMDFRCPACQVFATQTMPKLIEKYVKPGKLKITYQDFVVLDSQIAGSTESRDAAAAGRCAADQGKFWAYQDWLIANQSPIEAPGAFTLARLEQLAKRAGLDMTKFEPCLTSGRHNAEVLEESGTATSAGAPAFFVNGVEVAATGAAPGAYDGLASAIDAALAASTAAPKESPMASPTTSPGPAADAAQTFMFYTVKTGDTMQAIAGRFNVTLARLIAANPQIKDPNHITLGEIILIPWATWVPVVPVPTPASS